MLTSVEIGKRKRELEEMRAKIDREFNELNEMETQNKDSEVVETTKIAKSVASVREQGKIKAREKQQSIERKLGKWDPDAIQMKCHGQWLDPKDFEFIFKEQTSLKTWRQLDTVAYKLKRKLQMPTEIQMCTNCLIQCENCGEKMLLEEARMWGICMACNIFHK